MKKVILVGMACSGKNYLVNELINYVDNNGNKPFKYGVPYTTRKMRAGEVDGRDYNYVSYYEFAQMLNHNKFLQHMKFGNDYYGTTIDSYYDNNVFIMSPIGLSSMPPELRKNAIVVHVIENDSILQCRHEQRYENSGMSDEEVNRIINLRMSQDLDLFKGFKDYDIVCTSGDVSLIIDKVKA